MATFTNRNKYLLLWLRENMRAAAWSMTRFVAQRYGPRVGFVYVGGYPKSGTTWISRLVAHYLDMPFVRVVPVVPLVFKCVIHHHWSYHPALDRSIYVVRDGRDVMVSRYMNLMKGYTSKHQVLTGLRSSPLVRTLIEKTGRYTEVVRRLDHLFGSSFDPWDVKRNLPIFIEADMKNPFHWSVSLPWPSHVRNWRAEAKETVFVKYEDMLQDSVVTLSTVLTQYLETEISEQELMYTVKRYSFKQMTGRERGTEDRSSFARKGVHGDWKNYFSQEACQVFDHYAGDLLIELGYEANHQWVDNTSKT